MGSKNFESKLHNKKMQEIKLPAQTNSAMAQQTSATSEELTSQSETLNSMVSAFKTNAS